MWKEGKPVTAICHGTAALVNVKDQNGKHIISGRKVTSFSNTEEEEVKGNHKVPFLVETRVKEVLFPTYFCSNASSWEANMKSMLRIGGLVSVLMDNLLQVPILLVVLAWRMLSLRHLRIASR
jgi:hypothetical protein